MLRTVAVLLFGLAVVSAQVNQGKPDAVIVKKIYGNPPAAAIARNSGFVQQSAFVPGPTPFPVPIQYTAQPYPYYNYNYNQNYYNQYRGAYPGYYPGYQAVAPSAVPVYASPAPPPAPVQFPASPAPVKIQPQAQFVAGKSGVPDKDARILSEENKVDFDGTFSYAYQSDNGIAVNAKGYVKPPTQESEGPIQVIEGSYQSYSPEGIPVVISYIADENGYRASGDAIPTPYPELAQAYANAPVEKQKK